MNVKIEDSWREHLSEEFAKPYFTELTNFVRQEYQTATCYPPGRLIFNAFNLCPFDKVKVVIIGQDPYHGAGTRTQFFGMRRSDLPSFPSEYLQGDTARPWHPNSSDRQSHEMG